VLVFWNVLLEDPVAHILKERVLDALSGGDSEGVVNSQHPCQEVKDIVSNLRRAQQMGVLSVNELLPRLLLEILQFVIYLRHEFQIEFLNIIDHVWCTQDFRHLD